MAEPDVPRLTPEQAREARLSEMFFEPLPVEPDDYEDPDYGFDGGDPCR